MLRLHGVYRSRAARNVWLLNEIGVPFEHLPVIQAYRLTEADLAAFMAPLQASPMVVAIVGDTERMPMDALRAIAPVRVLSADEYFKPLD